MTGIGYIVDITGMKEFDSKPLDDLRKEDYETGRSAVKSTTGILQPQANFSGSTGLLASSQSAGFPGFGSSSILNQSASAPASSFSAPSAPQPAAAFGSSGSLGQPQQTPGFSIPLTQNSSFAQPSANGIFLSNTSGFNTPPATQRTSFLSQSNPLPSQTASTPNTTGINVTGIQLQPQTSSAFTQQPQNHHIQNNIFSSSIQSNPSAPSNQLQASSGINLTRPNNLPGPSFQNIFQSSSNQQQNPFNPFKPQNSIFNTENQSNMSLFNSDQANQNKIQMGSNPQIDTFQNINSVYNDPYLIQSVAFDKHVDQKPNFKSVLPKPIFEYKKDSDSIDLKIRPPKKISRSGIFTSPDLNDLISLKNIKNFVVGFENKGKIEFLEPVSLDSSDDIEKKINFKGDTVEMMDPVGTGLNKSARVYVESVFPYSRSTDSYIKGKAETWPNKGIQERFIYQLKNHPKKRFIDYDVDTGLYAYEVNHF